MLSQARALASARCGNGAAQSFSRAQATSVVLGFCGLGDLLPGLNLGWSSGNAGSSSTGNGYADANGQGMTGNNGFTEYNGGYSDPSNPYGAPYGRK